MFANTCEHSRAIPYTFGWMSGAIAEGRLLNMFETGARSKTVGPWSCLSSWLSECPLFSPALWSLRIASITFYLFVVYLRVHACTFAYLHPETCRSSMIRHPLWIIARDSFGSNKETIGRDSGRRSGLSQTLIHRGTTWYRSGRLETTILGEMRTLHRMIL